MTSAPDPGESVERFDMLRGSSMCQGISCLGMVMPEGIACVALLLGDGISQPAPDFGILGAMACLRD